MSDQFDPDTVEYDDAGLVPAIVQDRASGDVLMLGYMNRDSLQQTLTDGLVTFWSRSRQQLWRKGETSGNELHLVSVRSDCDNDALLVIADPIGPTCHTGSRTCFTDSARQGFRRLEGLWDVIADRVATRPEGSYTASLVSQGVDATARKVAEEATEVVLAAKNHAGGDDAGELAEEAADLIYHLLVLLAERGEAPARLLDVLERRS